MHSTHEVQRVCDSSKFVIFIDVGYKHQQDYTTYVQDSKQALQWTYIFDKHCWIGNTCKKYCQFAKRFKITYELMRKTADPLQCDYLY